MAPGTVASDLSSLEDHQSAIENWVANLNRQLSISKARLTAFEGISSDVTKRDLNNIRNSLDDVASSVHGVCLCLQETDDSILAIRDTPSIKVVILRMKGDWKDALAHTADRLQMLSSRVQEILTALEAACNHAEILLQHTKEFVREGSDFKAKNIAPLKQAIEVVSKTMREVDVEGETLLSKTKSEHDAVSRVRTHKRTALDAKQEAVRSQQAAVNAQKSKIRAMETRCRDVQKKAQSSRTTGRVLGGASVLGIIGVFGAVIATGGVAAPAVLGVASLGSGVASAVKSDDADTLFAKLPSMKRDCEKLETKSVSIRKELGTATTAMEGAQSEYDAQCSQLEAVNETIKKINTQKQKHQSALSELSEISSRCAGLNSRTTALQKSMQQLKSEASSCVVALQEYLADASCVMDPNHATIEPVAYSQRKSTLLEHVTSVLKMFEENRPLLNSAFESAAIYTAMGQTRRSDAEVMEYLNHPKLVKAREKKLRKSRKINKAGVQLIV